MLFYRMTSGIWSALLAYLNYLGGFGCAVKRNTYRLPSQQPALMPTC